MRCDTKRTETAMKMSTVIVKTVTSILKNIALNICIFIVGVSVGYGISYIKIQKDIYSVDHDDCIMLIEQKVDEMAELDKKYTQNQVDIKQLLKKIQLSLLAK